MRAASITGSRALGAGSRALEIRELELPVPGPGEVRIRAGLSILVCGREGPTWAAPPQVLGT